MDGMMRRRNMGIKSGGAVIDNAPVIEFYDTKLNANSTTSPNTGTCTTDWVTVPQQSGRMYCTHYGCNGVTLDYLDDARKDYWNWGSVSAESTSGSITHPCNRMKLTLQTDMLDDCYAYVKDQSQNIESARGYILFAGRNSIYYGHQFIQEVQ